jgi:tetratricopeptide (TPR) repeat protein
MAKPIDSFERIAVEFEVDVYTLGRKLNPGATRILDPLATGLSVLGRHGEALGVLNELIAVEPRNARFLYNRACALSRLGQENQAVKELSNAVRWGFDDFDYLLSDTDLAPLHHRTEFNEYRRRARVQRTRTVIRAK